METDQNHVFFYKILQNVIYLVSSFLRFVSYKNLFIIWIRLYIKIDWFSISLPFNQFSSEAKINLILPLKQNIISTIFLLKWMWLHAKIKRKLFQGLSRTRIVLRLKDVITFERNIIISKDYIWDILIFVNALCVLYLNFFKKFLGIISLNCVHSHDVSWFVLM